MSLPVTPGVVVGSPDRARDAPARARGLSWSAVEHVGPAWFPAAMGTGILATCTQGLAAVVPALHGPALLLLALAWLVLAAVGGTFLLHALRRPDRFRATVADLAVAPFYGAVSMGLLAVGSATLAVAGPHLPTAATAVAWVLWAAGTLLGVVTAVGHPMRLLAAGPAGRGAPTPVWALPVVPPMVSASGGAVLAGTLPPAAASAVLLLCGALFVLALSLGTVVFVLAYGRLARGHALPLQGSPAIWIPLGVAGQSTAAANFVLAEADRLLPPGALAVLHELAVGYSVLALSLGAVAAGVALRVTAGALRRGMTFSLSWWSFTFPVGTMSLGLLALGTTLGAPWLLGASAAVCACLAGTVGLCLVRSVRLWRTGRP
jgi:tellurite resistance protein TehA-like permease